MRVAPPRHLRGPGYPTHLAPVSEGRLELFHVPREVRVGLWAQLAPEVGELVTSHQL